MTVIEQSSSGLLGETPIAKVTRNNLGYQILYSTKIMLLSILFVGKLGAGKSYLVKSFLVGETETKGRSGRSPSTCTVERFDARIGNLDAILWDTPGLRPENYKSCLKELSTTVQQIGLVVYCLKMDDARFHLNDREAIQHLTKAFGNEIWKHAIIALTFGNKMTDPDEINDEEYFSAMLQSWKDIIREYLVKCSVKESVVQEIPFIPVGSRRRLKLADNKNWKETFLMECVKRLADCESPMKLVYGAREEKTLRRYTKTAREYLKGHYKWAGFGICVCVCTAFALFICEKMRYLTSLNINLNWCQTIMYFMSNLTDTSSFSYLYMVF